MIDTALRSRVEKPLRMMARTLASLKIKPDHVTILGFVIGILVIPALAWQNYPLALLCIVMNRMCDGLDGALAREVGGSDFGGFFDIVADFTFYAAVVFGFSLAQPEHAIYANFLLFSFFMTGTSFLAFGIFAHKYESTDAWDKKRSFSYLSGLVEGAETIVALILMCLLPKAFPIIAMVFGVMCLVTGLTRIIQAYELFKGKV